MNTSTDPIEVITIGETMLRFTPPAYERLGQSRAVEMHVGGSESNTAVGLARLGHRVSWISRLTDNPLGRWIAQEIASHGVDVSHVVWTNNDRIGTYYMERGRPPRSSQVFYDRAASAMSQMSVGELPVDLFQPQVAKILHVTGITVGIAEQAQQTILRAVELAQAAEMKISFDLNYRAKLWSAAESYRACKPILAKADYIFLPARDAQTVCGVKQIDRPRAICDELHSRWPQATIILTLGSSGAAAVNATGDYYAQAAFPAEEVERLGGGDAFSAGYLSAVLQGADDQLALTWAAAAAALKYTIPGDLPLIDKQMVMDLINNSCGQQSLQR